MVNRTPVPLDILNYVKEKCVPLTHFLFHRNIFFISAEMINSAEVNTFLSWFSCVLLPLFLFWHSGILLLKENSEGCILWIKICVRKGDKIERKRRKGIKRSFEVDTAKILIQSLLLFSDSVQIFGAFLRNQWDWWASRRRLTCLLRSVLRNSAGPIHC